jgi:hypothetical protein
MNLNYLTEQKKLCTVTALPIIKSYKSHSKTIENIHSLAVAFIAFWAISLYILFSELTIRKIQL